MHGEKNKKNDSLRILIGDGVCVNQTLRISIHPTVGKVAIAQVSEAGLRGWVAYRINVIRTVNLGLWVLWTSESQNCLRRIGRKQYVL